MRFNFLSAAAIAASFSISSLSLAAGGDESCVDAANAAEVLKKDVGALSKAREKLLVCAADACPPIIRDDCRRSLVGVEANLPSVVLVAEGEVGGAEPIDVHVMLDGAPFAKQLDGKPLSVDVGNHTFSFVREGSPPVDVRVTLRPAQKNVEVIARLPKAVGVAPVVPVSDPAKLVVADVPSPDGSPTASPLRAVGIVTSGVGVAGIGAGAIFGLRASGKQSDANCPSNICDLAKGGNPYTLRDAQSAATLSTIFVVSGAVLLAGGVAMYLLAPKRAPSSARSNSVYEVGKALLLGGASF